MITKNIYIFVSEVATIINENPYDLIRPFNRLINKYANIDIENTIITKEELLKSNPVFIETLKLSREKFGSNIKSVKENILNDKTLDIQTVTNIINTEFGVENELNAIELFEKKYSRTIKGQLDTSQKFYSKRICSEINASITYNYYLGGKCDALTEEYILEVKNRVNKFFNCLKDYEKVQVQLYMYLLEKKKCKLVEKYKNNIKVLDIYKNEEYIENTLSKLKVFCKYFTEFLQDESQIYYYISLNDTDKKSFIYNLYVKSFYDDDIETCDSTLWD
jgi:hypothetical protein